LHNFTDSAHKLGLDLQHPGFFFMWFFSQISQGFFTRQFLWFVYQYRYFWEIEFLQILQAISQIRSKFAYVGAIPSLTPESVTPIYCAHLKS
jgi:hypothetical protein